MGMLPCFWLDPFYVVKHILNFCFKDNQLLKGKGNIFESNYELPKDIGS